MDIGEGRPKNVGSGEAEAEWPGALEGMNVPATRGGTRAVWEQALFQKSGYLHKAEARP